MKILFVTRHTHLFFYHETIIRHLAKKGHDVQVLFSRESAVGNHRYRLVDTDSKTELIITRKEEGETSRLNDYSRSVNTNGITLGRIIQRNDRWNKSLAAIRETRTFGSYVRRRDKSVFSPNQRKFLPIIIQKFLKVPFIGKVLKLFLSSHVAELILKVLEKMIPVCSEIKEWLEQDMPDVVVVSPINWHSIGKKLAGEIEYLKAAQAIGIPTVVPVLSWDNLSARGLYYISPDLTLAWNEKHFRLARDIHGIQPEKIIITGSPFFDKWFDRERLIVEKEHFLDRVGIDFDNSYVLYLGSTKIVLDDEKTLVRDIISLFRSHADPEIRNTQLIIRAHPANAKYFETFHNPSAIVWPRKGAFPGRRKEQKDFFSMVYHSVATIGVNTTGMVDALVMDKPTIAIMNDKYKEGQLLTDHFPDLLRADVLEIAKNIDECAELVIKIMKGDDSKRNARRRFIKEYVRPRGLNRNAGEVAAKAIEMLGAGKTVKEIDMALH